MSPQREPAGPVMVDPNHLENQTFSGLWAAVRAGVAVLGSVVLLSWHGR